MPKVDTKDTNRKCRCVICRLPIIKGDIRIFFDSRGWFHAQCFVDLVESIPDVDKLWANAVTKNVLLRLKGGNK